MSWKIEVAVFILLFIGLGRSGMHLKCFTLEKINLNSSKFLSITGVVQECDRFQWRCNNGECILAHQLCDGTANCRDASDETKNTCENEYCPPYAYRCVYGGCVDGDAECNGVKDCYDGSDEAEVKCGTRSMPAATMKPATCP